MLQKPHISPKEWRGAGGWSVAVLLLSCIPYLIAILITPEDWQFAGIMVNPFDAHSYLAKMRQGFEGDWLFHLTYTPEPHQGAFIFTFYLALGHVAALTGLPLIWVFHLARLAAGLGLLLVSYRFIALVTPALKERRLAFLFLCTASGFGWLGVIFGAFPIDLWVPEAFVPYSLFANPHFPMGMMLMLLIFQQIASPSTHRSAIANNQPLITTLWAGLAGLALALILPFALLTLGAVVAVYLAWFYLTRRRLPWQQIWPTLGVGFFSTPVIAYDYWIVRTNPILAGWSAQNITEAPSPLNFGLGYGLIGLLAIIGAVRVIGKTGTPPKPMEWLVLLWAVTTVILVYLPFALQRRLITGLHIPLCILAAIGLVRWSDRLSIKMGYRHLITGGVIAIGAVGTLFVWGLPLIGMLQSPAGSETAALFFLRQEEITALTWLRERSSEGDIVLASPRLGMFIPGQTGARAFYGHPFETIEAETKKAMAEAFYQGDIKTVSPAADFIIYGPSERALGRSQNLSDYPIVFSADDVTIYQPTGSK